MGGVMRRVGVERIITEKKGKERQKKEREREK